MRVNRIAADAQDLGIVLLEPAVSLPEEGSLAGSTRGEVKDVERKHHRLFSPVLAQGYFAVVWRWQFEIWGYIANFCRHIHTPLDYGRRDALAAGPIIPHIHREWLPECHCRLGSSVAAEVR